MNSYLAQFLLVSDVSIVCHSYSENSASPTDFESTEGERKTFDNAMIPVM
jgi:hypothetical protein